MIKKIIFIANCIYWIFSGLKWFCQGTAEVFNAISGFLSEIKDDDKDKKK